MPAGRAEKLVKAVLVSAGVHPPKSHDIGSLVDLLPGTHPLVPVVEPLARFSPYAWVFRYPSAAGEDSETEEPSLAEAAEWLAELQAARGAVEAALRRAAQGAPG